MKIQTVKSTSEFHRRSGRQSGLASQCKTCNAARNAIYYATHKEKVAARKAARYRGEGPDGLLGRFAGLLSSARSDSRRGGYAPPFASPEDIVEIWNRQEGRCAITGRPLDLLGRGTHLDHDHETGEVRGFVLHDVNVIEGRLKDFTRKEWIAIYDFYRPAPLTAKVELRGKIIDQKKQLTLVDRYGSIEIK